MNRLYRRVIGSSQAWATNLLKAPFISRTLAVASSFATSIGIASLLHGGISVLGQVLGIATDAIVKLFNTTSVAVLRSTQAQVKPVDKPIPIYVPSTDAVIKNLTIPIPGKET